MAEPSTDDLKALATMRLADARVLQDASCYSAAYYLAGYAVECGLKAIIARSFRASVIPDRAFVQKIYSHDLSALVTLANLKSDLDVRVKEMDDFRTNWSIVSGWSEASRYEMIDGFTSLQMLHSIGSEKNGVLPWLKEHW